MSSVLNVSNSSTSSNGLYNYVNVCNNINDYAGVGYECVGSTTYMMRMTGITLTINGDTKTYVALFQSNNSSVPVTWSASVLQRFNDTFGYNLSIPSGLRNAFFVLPYDELSTPYNYNSVRTVVPDFDNPVWLSYNDWGSFNASVVYKPVLIVPPTQSSDDSSGDTSDYSQISNAIYTLGGVIIVVCFFSMIYKIFHRLRG